MKNIKSLIRELVEEQLKEMSTTAGAGGYNTPFAFKGKRGKNTKLPTVVMPLSLNEVSFRNFTKNINQTSPKYKIRKSLRELRNRVNELNSLVEYSSQLKESMGDDKVYWNSTKQQINELAIKLVKTIKKLNNLHQ